LVDDLGDGTPAVCGGADVALMQAGAHAELLHEVVGEFLGLRAVAGVTGCDGGVLGAQTTTDRRTDTARSSSHESDSAAQLVAGVMPGGILLFGVQGGHDGFPPAGRSALVAAVDRGCVPTDRRDVQGASTPPSAPAMGWYTRTGEA
jgi:hypothetical protein